MQRVIKISCLFLSFLVIYLSIEVLQKGYLYYIQCNNQVYPEIREVKEPQEKKVNTVKVKKEKKIISPLSGYTKKQIIYWHSIRYGIAKELKPFIITKYCGKMVKRSDLEKTIRAVFQRLPNIKTSSNLVELIIETCEVETLRGIESKNTVSSATGLFQILPRTARDTLKWLKINHKDVYRSLMDMYNKKLSLKDNLYYNVPFSIGLSATYYWRMSPNLWKRIDTHEKRAELWANVYNTYLDPQGTAKFFMKQVKKVKNKNV